MSVFELLSSHAAALEAAGNKNADAVLGISEALGLYQAARAHYAIVSSPAWGASTQEIIGARRRVQHRWDAVLDALLTYDMMTAYFLAKKNTPALDEALLDVPSVMAAVQMQAPSPDEAGRDYDPDYTVPFLEAPAAPEEKKPEPKSGLAVLSQEDIVAAAMAQIHDLPARVSDWPDPAGLLADVKPASGDILMELDGRPVIISESGEIVCDGAEVPF